MKPSRVVARPAILVSTLSASLFIVAVFLALQTLRVSIVTHSALPQEDEWYSLLLFKKMLTGNNFIEDLFSQHNEHRIAFPRLVLFADYFIFKGRGWFDVAVIFLTQALHAGLFIYLLRDSGTKRKAGVALASIVIVLLFSLRQSENFVWGFQVQFVGVFAAASLAIVFFAEAMAGRGGKHGSAARMAASFVLVAVASFTMTNGLLSGIVLIVLAMLARSPQRVVLAATALTACLVGAFSLGYHVGEGAESLAGWIAHPTRLAAYTAAYLGNFLEPDLDGAVVFGASGLAAMIAILARFALRRDTHPARLALLGIALFAAGSAFMTALGRSSDGIEGAMASRYSTGAAAFWLAILTCGWSAGEQSNTPVARRALVATAAGVLLFQALRCQAPTAAYLEQRAFKQKTIENALLVGLDDTEALEAMDEPVEVVREITPLLRDRGISIFASKDARLVGRPLSEAGNLEANPCNGSFETASGDPTLGHDGVRANGTANVRHAWPGLNRVYLADPNGTIVGLASTPVGSSAWSGYAAASPRTTLHAFALFGSGRLCELGSQTVSSGDALTEVPRPSPSVNSSPP